MATKKKAANSHPVNCQACGSTLKTVDYTIWGTKKYDLETNSYIEDETLGNSDMEFRCPTCSGKLDPEDIIL